MAKKLFVRYSEAGDEKAIFDFYAENTHAFVFQRDPEVWKERISAGAVTIIHDESGKIVASSISYPVIKDADGVGKHMWTEIGSTRVALEGIGLFNALMSAQIVRAYLLEPPEDRFAIEIMQGNDHSKHVFLKVGAASFDPPRDFLEAYGATITSDNSQTKVDWFQFGVEAMPQLARLLLDKAENPKVVNKKTGEEFEFDFSRCTVTTIFRDALEDIAQRDFGDNKLPNQKHGIKSFRNKFHP